MAKKKKKKLQWLWIVIPVVIILFSAFYSFSKNNAFQSQQSSSKYLVYQNPIYKFSIEYPKAWEIRKNTQVFENGDAIAFGISGPTQKKYTELSDGAQLAVSKPLVINTDLATWMKNYFNSQTKFSKLSLSNYTFEAVEVCEYLECMRYYFTKIDSQIYGVALYAEGTNAEKASYENALLYMLKSLQLPDTTKGTITKEEAVTRIGSLPEVKEYLNRVPNGLVAVNGTDDSSYMVQVYEVKDGHTATFNWYRINKQTGEVKKEF